MIFNGDKLGRVYRLTVQENQQYFDALAKPIQKKDTGTQETPFADISNPYTIEFNINRHTLASLNTATFKIYNLGAETRDKLYKDLPEFNPYRAITFAAGYDSSYMPIVFKGNILTAISYKTGCDIVTEIEATDGGMATAAGLVNMNWGITTTQAQIINDLCKAVPGTDGVGFISPEYNKVTHKRQAIHHGNPWRRLQIESGNRAYIDSGLIYVMHDYEAFDDDVITVSAETGLIGSPKRSGFNIEGEMIFEPRMTVGQLIKIQSQINKFINGTYKVNGFTHTGMISDAVGGSCKTTFSVWLGADTLKAYRRTNTYNR